MKDLNLKVEANRTTVVCDLDDALLKTDLLIDGALSLLRSHPKEILRAVGALNAGRASLKNFVAEKVPLYPEHLPFNTKVLDILLEAKERGCQLILASASPQKWVQQVADHLGIFDQVLGSTPSNNLKGGAKLAAVKAVIGDAPFVYIGDSWSDLPIWAESAEIVAVHPSGALKRKIKSLGKPTTFVANTSSALKILVKQMRVHQWVKNALVFLPLLLGHRLELPLVLAGFSAFFSFSFMASFVYIMNDLLDIQSDRAHPTKRFRPIASGNLSVRRAGVAALLLAAGSLALANYLPSGFTMFLVAYLLLNIAYSAYLKSQIIADIIVLSFMYTLRILAGSAATGVPTSEWLFIFSLFFFFSLACVKRTTELGRRKDINSARGYQKDDYLLITILGVCSGFLAALVLSLYFKSDEVTQLYQQPMLLWLSAPIMLYWLGRLWLLNSRDLVHDDPVVFAIKDKVSWICFLALLAVLGLSI